MQLALPQVERRDAYHYLATLYTIVFAAAAVSFYLTLLRGSSDAESALFAAVAAGLHYGLLRLAGSAEAAPPQSNVRRFTPTRVLANSDLLARLEQLRHESRNSHDEIGLMLIRLDSDDGFGGALSAEMSKLVRGELFRAADSRIFQVDENTLAIAEAQSDVVLHFDKISMELQRQLRAAQPREAASAPRATIGVAVASSGRSSSVEDLLDGARSAIGLAESNHRDTFFRRVS